MMLQRRAGLVVSLMSELDKERVNRLSTEVNRICHKFQPSFGGANWREVPPGTGGSEL